MHTAIIFASKNVFAEQYAGSIAEKLTGSCRMFNIAFESDIELSSFSHVVVGGCLVGGRLQKEIIEFCIKNMNILMQHKVGLYINCMNQAVDPNAFNDFFTADLSQRAVAKECFEEKAKKSGFAERSIHWMENNMMAQGDSGRGANVSRSAEERLTRFVQRMSRA